MMGAGKHLTHPTKVTTKEREQLFSTANLNTEMGKNIMDIWWKPKLRQMFLLLLTTIIKLCIPKKICT